MNFTVGSSSIYSIQGKGEVSARLLFDVSKRAVPYMYVRGFTFEPGPLPPLGPGQSSSTCSRSECNVDAQRVENTGVSQRRKACTPVSRSLKKNKSKWDVGSGQSENREDTITVHETIFGSSQTGACIPHTIPCWRGTLENNYSLDPMCVVQEKPVDTMQ